MSPVVLVTGGTSGLGRAIADTCVHDGNDVYFTGRRTDRGEKVMKEIENKGYPGSITYIYADHTSPDDCSRCVSQILSEKECISVLINCCGIVVNGTAEETDESTWADVLNTNVTTVWRMSRLVIPCMRKAHGGGCIVNIASDWGLVGAQNAVAYCTSKGAVVQMTRAMALDHAHEGIRINAVCPGDVYVERWSEDGYYRGSGPVARDVAERECGQDIPLGRVGHIDDIAKAVNYVIGADFMTGATVVVDGGSSVGSVKL